MPAAHCARCSTKPNKRKGRAAAAARSVFDLCQHKKKDTQMANTHKDNNSIPFRANEGFPVSRKAFANRFDILLQIATPILYAPLL